MILNNRNRWSALAALACAAAHMPAPAIAQAAVDQPAVAQSPADGDVQAFLRDVRSYYETAGAPTLINDHGGRLAIYRETLRRLDNAPEALRSDPRYRRDHLFYAVAEATTRADVGDIEGARTETDRLLPEVRAHIDRNPADSDMTEALARLLRTRGQVAQVSGDLATALPLFREAAERTQQWVNSRTGADRAYRERALAIDLDNLANLEAQAGNGEEADRESSRALELFRSLAADAPDSRPAQGSLLIALLRRGVNFGEVERIDEAESLIAQMRSRGQLVGQYAAVAAQMPAIRREAARARQQ